MVKTAREQMAELETTYKSRKKDLNARVKVEEAKELAGVFDATLNASVEALRASVTAGLGVYHRNLKSVVVRVSLDGNGVTTVKNTIHTIRMTPKEIEAWDTAHVELSRGEIELEMQTEIDASVAALQEYGEETLRLELEVEEPQESETQAPEPAVEPAAA